MTKTPTSIKKIWFQLKPAIFNFLFSFILILILFWLTHLYKNYIQQWELSQRSFAITTQTEYHQLKELLAVVNSDDFVFFKQLLAQNYLDKNTYSNKEDARIAGIEHAFTVKKQIESYAKQLKIPRISLITAPVKVLDLPHIQTEQEFQVYETRFTLQAELLHEEDLLKLLSDIQSNIYDKGLLKIKKCHLFHKQDINKDEPLQAHISAECTLFWYQSRIENYPQ